jgi:hypothetical protein
MFGWQEFAVAKGSDLRKIDLSLAPITTALGVLGMPGLKAFFGLLDVCYPQRGETVVVSGATGAVGMLAGQIALLEGCRVVGIASSSDADISWLLDELGFDAAFNQSFDADYDARLAELCPDGIDVYFDDVGGAITDAALRRINGRARVSICGQSSQDNLEEPGAGPRWLQLLIDREARVQGFLVSGYAERYPEGRRQLTSWLAQGKLKYREDVAQGIEAAPQAFIAMLRGTGHGGQLVRLQGMWPDEIQGLAG